MPTYEIGDGDARDQDETRRLLYMLRFAPLTDRYNLAGTLLNALVHHSGNGSVSVEDAAHYILRALKNDDPGGTVNAWVNDQIARMTAELEGPPAEFRG